MSIALFIPWSRKTLGLGLAFIYLGPNFAFANRTAFFYNSSNPSQPSYISSSQTLTRINHGNETFQFKIEKGVITNVVVEKWFGARRIAIELALKNQKYNFVRAFVTNQRLYFSHLKDSTRLDMKCTSQQSPKNTPYSSLKAVVDKVNSEVSSETSSALSIDASCNEFPGKERFLAFKEFLDPKTSKGQSLQSCLSKLAVAPANWQMRERIGNIEQTIFGLSQEKKQCGLAGLTIACQSRTPGFPSDKLATTNSSGLITFYPIDDEFTGIPVETLEVSFLHELVHVGKSPLATQAIEEALADGISKTCFKSGPDLASALAEHSDSVQFIGTETKSRITTSELSKSDDLKIAQAVQAVPPQMISSSDLSTVAEISKGTNSSNAKFINNTFGSVFSKPMNAFSQMADKVASIVIPEAGASTSTSRSTLASTKNSKREIASARDTSVGSSEKLVEEILLPDPKNPASIIKKTIEHDETDSTTLAVAGSEVRKKSKNQTSSASRLPVSSGRDAPTTSVGASAADSSVRPSGFTQNLNNASSSQTNSANTSKLATPFASVDGVIFTAGKITGPSYLKYKTRKKDLTFLHTLENKGILITQDGSLISKPAKVTVAYIDNGNSLVYADF